MALRRLVFISYRRVGGYELAHLVNAELRSRGLATFIDVADSDPGKFWPQIQASIRSCRALVLICTKGSFEAKGEDDWVLREVSEATTLGRPIIPVFAQDFQPPAELPSAIAQALQYNGISMDTQFHVAAFDHLSQLVGGRKRSEQRRRVASLTIVASLLLLATVALGASQIARLTDEFHREREARQAADARSERLASEMAAQETRRTDERLAAEARQRELEARGKRLAESLVDLERKSADQARAALERERLAKEEAERRDRQAEHDLVSRRANCLNQCRDAESSCELSCDRIGRFDQECTRPCRESRRFCEASCEQ